MWRSWCSFRNFIADVPVPMSATVAIQLNMLVIKESWTSVYDGMALHISSFSYLT